MFILGLIVGLLIAFGCSLAILDTDDETLARDELLEENDRNGVDTELESII